MTNENIRYDRQQRIQNWQQEKLANARVAIVGTGQLAQFTAASLVALGVGNVEIYGNEKVVDREFLTSAASRGDYKVSVLESKLHEMNPNINIRGIRMGDNDSAIPEMGRQDLVLDLTNSSELKEKVLEYASSHGIKAISASTGKTGGELHYVQPGENNPRAKTSKYEGESQGAFTSEVLGGMITEEVRKVLMPLNDKEEAVKSLAYNATAERRFSKEGDFDAQPYEDLSQKRVLIIGAGALGNFVALGAALEGIGKIDIMDFDHVEDHNLNRQIMFYDSVGREKASALAEKVRQINPNVEVKELIEKLDEKTSYFANIKPDLILDCVDSFATRAITNFFGVHHKIPIVSGGTNSQSGQVVVYEPGHSACLECKLGVEQALGISLQGAKCSDAPNPSVIMTNEVIGGMMVGEALKVLDKGYGAPVQRILKYDSTVPVRGGLVGAVDPCECSRGDVKEWIKEVKDRFSLKPEVK